MLLTTKRAGKHSPAAGPKSYQRSRKQKSPTRVFDLVLRRKTRG